MAENPIYEIPETPVYDPIIEKFTETTPAHADNFNRMHQRLIENMAAVKAVADMGLVPCDCVYNPQTKQHELTKKIAYQTTGEMIQVFFIPDCDFTAGDTFLLEEITFTPAFSDTDFPVPSKTFRKGKPVTLVFHRPSAQKEAG